MTGPLTKKSVVAFPELPVPIFQLGRCTPGMASGAHCPWPMLQICDNYAEKISIYDIAWCLPISARSQLVLSAPWSGFDAVIKSANLSDLYAALKMAADNH
jgi:hypothetical protein